jgi:hypothetical protein
MSDEPRTRWHGRKRQRGASSSVRVVPTVDDEADHIVRRYALRCGAIGAIGAVPATAAAAALPASALSTFALHMRMIREIARLYGHRPDTYDFETDALAIMAGDATKETLKRASVEWSHEFAWRSLQRVLTARASQRMDAALSSGVVVVGVPRPLARLVPLAGAPVGFGIDYAFARAVGSRAIAQYRPQMPDADA